MSDLVPFVLLSEGTGTEAGAEDGVIGDSIPFVSLSVGTGTEEPTPQAPTILISTPIPIPIAPSGAGAEDCVMSDAIPFVSSTVGTEAEVGTEEPTPQSPTIPIPISTPIPFPPPALPHIFFLTSWASHSSPPAPASDMFSTMDSVSVTTK